MLFRYEIYARLGRSYKSFFIEARSKYAAKQIFYRQNPTWEIVSVREAVSEG